MGEESEKSCWMITVTILLVPSGCTIPALHIGLCMHRDRHSMLLSLGLSVQRLNLGTASAWLSAQPLFFTELLKHRLIQTTEIHQRLALPLLGGQQQLVDT